MGVDFDLGGTGGTVPVLPKSTGSEHPNGTGTEDLRGRNAGISES